MNIGRQLATILKPGDVVCLEGDLGAGKTTMIKGVAEGFKINPRQVNSPTFVIMNIYKGRRKIYHFDFYRIASDDLLLMDYEEFFYSDGIALVEWPERLGEIVPHDRIIVELKHQALGKRRIRIKVVGKMYSDRLKQWVVS